MGRRVVGGRGVLCSQKDQCNGKDSMSVISRVAGAYLSMRRRDEDAKLRAIVIHTHNRKNSFVLHTTSK